jgi:hypothetical protein
MLDYFIFEFPDRAIKVLGILETGYFHDFLWFFEICVTTPPLSPPVAPKSVSLQPDVLMPPFAARDDSTPAPRNGILCEPQPRRDLKAWGVNPRNSRRSPASNSGSCQSRPKTATHGATSCVVAHYPAGRSAPIGDREQGTAGGIALVIRSARRARG